MEKNVLQDFLETEIDSVSQELYDGMFEFIDSGHIRVGEYECNIYIIKKLDVENFEIYEEYEFSESPEPNRPTEFGPKIKICRDELILKINDRALEQGLKVKKS